MNDFDSLISGLLEELGAENTYAVFGIVSGEIFIAMQEHPGVFDSMNEKQKEFSYAMFGAGVYSIAKALQLDGD